MKFIEDNKYVFKNKTILDISCGTGNIISILYIVNIVNIQNII
jgi:ubiquinone/menaquinone biosynthesis C-methylase UbiE